MKQIFRKKNHYDAIVLLDRDGTINKLVGYLIDPKQLELLPTVIEGIHLLNKNHIAVIVLTNQPQIAHNLLSIADLKKINEVLYSLLAQNDAYIDAIYFCPHHPQGSVKEFSIACTCRKPNTFLYENARKEYNATKVLGIIGDTTRDIQLGGKVGIPTAMIQTNHIGEYKRNNVKADFICKNFLQSVEKLLMLL